MKSNEGKYEYYWRNNYEMWSLWVWCGAIAATSMVARHHVELPAYAFFITVGIMTVLMAYRMPKAFEVAVIHRALRGFPLESCTLGELEERVKTSKKKAKKKGSGMDTYWLGKGYMWETTHAQRVFDIIKTDQSNVIGKRRLEDMHGKGAPWIHGVEPKEYDLNVPVKFLEGNTLVTGTTGAGKTRLFDLLITQAIMRGDRAVIVFDPKGDRDLCENMRRACKAMNAEDRFAYFHPGFPRQSVRINPLKNFSRGTQPASRVAALIESEGTDPFKNFGQSAMNHITQGLLLVKEKPSLVLLRRYLEGDAVMLTVKAIEGWCSTVLGEKYESVAASYLDGIEPHKTKQLLRQSEQMYIKEVQPIKANSDLEGLISMANHPGEHFSKMVASLLPILDMLTSGEMGPLLSPDVRDTEDDREILDSYSIIRDKRVIWVGLDSLSDEFVASAIGSLLVSDLTSTAGDVYNYEVGTGKEPEPVEVYSDEAGEIFSSRVVQLLNKGRGSGFRATLAIQSVADLSAKMGSKDRAMQALGNLNNVISLRVIDPDTQEYITSKLVKTRIKHVMRTQGTGTNSDDPKYFSGNIGERLMEEEGDLVSPQLLNMLPDLEFFAFLAGGNLIKGRIPILGELKK
jgi:conjugal transfer pilus assembly protein TraD